MGIAMLFEGGGMKDRMKALCLGRWQPSEPPMPPPSLLSVPIRAVLAVLRRWSISDQAETVMFGTDGSFAQRARLFLDIYEGIFSLLRNPEAEREWIAVPRQELDGQSVYDLMTEGSVRDLIRAQAFVDYANGRKAA